MTAIDVLTRLRALGVQVSPRDDRLTMRGPSGFLTPELAHAIEEHRAELLRLIAPPPSSSPLPIGAPLSPSGSSSTESPLSHGQRTLWFDQQLQPDACHYNVPVTIALGAGVSVVAVEQALRQVVDAHPTLRARFPIRGDRPVMEIVSDRPRFILSRVDLPETASESMLTRTTRAFIRRPFDLAANALFRGCVVRRGSESTLVISFHHIVADGWSMGILLRDFQRVYEALRSGSTAAAGASTPAALSYTDFATWQTAPATRAGLAPMIASARTTLTDVPDLRLPRDIAPPANPTWRGGICRTQLSRADCDRLAALGRRCGATLFGVLSAAYAVLLSCESGQERFAIGTDVTGRDDQAWEEIVGHFVNQIVMVADLSGNPTLEEIIERASRAFHHAWSVRQVPFDLLVKAIREDASAVAETRAPLFRAKLVMQPPLQQPWSSPSFRVLPIHDGTCKFDLLVNVWLSDDGAGLTLEYSEDLFHEATGARLLQHFLWVMECLREEHLTWRLTDVRDQLVTRAKARRARPVLSSVARARRAPEPRQQGVTSSSVTPQDVTSPAHTLAP